MDPIYLNGLTSVFWFLVVITVVVFVHEFGHYIVARLNGVKVETFSIGFGTELIGWNDSHGTRWKIAMIPMGGYVKMYGDADPSSSPDFDKLKKLTKKEKSQSFYFKALWQKALVVVAGPAANYLLAIAILATMFTVHGKAYIIPEITAVMEGSVADKAGIKAGDMVKKIDNKEIETFDNIRQILALNTGDTLHIVIERKSKVMEFAVTPEIKVTKDTFGNAIKMPMLGITSNRYENEVLTFGQAAVEAIKDSYNISAGMLQAVGQMLIGARGTDDLGGPIKIAKYSGQSAEAGVSGVLWFIALISINLGLVNLFPIPMLDGGHLMYYAIEAIKGKPVSEKFQMIGFRIGLTLLIALMIFVTFKDIISLVRIS
jgi:regulator of sigma E protease